MIETIYNNIIYLLKLTSKTEVLWTIFPLIIATIVMLIYFEKYSDENPGWNTYVANSLVLLFISAILFRYLFQINGGGVINFINFPTKFAVSSFAFVLGITILFLDFGHIFPEKIARGINSPLTINLMGYTLLLFVYSEIANTWSLFLSLIILFFSLLLLLNLMKIPIKKLFIYLKKTKQKEEVENIVCEKNDIECKKRELEKRKKELKKRELKKLKEKKKELEKIKKIVKKI